MAKLKNLTVQNDPMERLTVNLHLSVLDKLTLYKQFYEKSLGGKLQLNSIVEEMLKTVMDEDKDFKTFLKAHEEAHVSAPVASKPAPVNREADAPRAVTQAAGAPMVSSNAELN